MKNFFRLRLSYFTFPISHFSSEAVMFCKLSLGLLLSTTFLWAQPVEGPWEVMASGAEFSHIYAVSRNDSITDMFYELGGGAYHQAARMSDGSLYAGPNTLAPTSGYSRSIDGVLMTDEGWVVLVQDESPDYGINKIFRGWDQIEQERTIDGISHVQSQWFVFGENWDARLFGDLQNGFWTSWVASRCYWIGSGWECFGFPDVRHYTAFDDTVADLIPCACWNFSCFPGWALVASLTADSSAVVYGTGNGFTISQLCREENLEGWGTEFTTFLIPLSLLSTHGERQLILSAHGGQIPARIIEYDTSGQVTELLPIQDNPLAAASHPSFGFAWLSRPSSGLLLNRADTTGALVHPAGVVRWPEEGNQIVQSNIALSENGKITVVWVEQTTDTTAPFKLWIAAVDWLTPLSTEPSGFILPPSSFILSAYPNPFNNSVRISYDLPKAGDVELEIYDVLGRHVQTLLNQTVKAGAHSIVWTPDGTSGIYFIHLRAGDETRVEKLMFIK